MAWDAVVVDASGRLQWVQDRGFQSLALGPGFRRDDDFLHAEQGFSTASVESGQLAAARRNLASPRLPTIICCCGCAAEPFM